jgi:ubiquinone/menaquinone biosynthesis C-methylase UbiE
VNDPTHRHEAGGGEGYGSAADYFDASAASWDQDPEKVKRAARAAELIRAVVPLDERSRVLDYGAGTGLLGQHLKPAVGPMTMADPSAGMRAVIREKATALGLDDLTIVDLDLTRDPVPDQTFDLVATLLALHHVDDPPRVLAAFARLLAPGGWVAIVDLEAEDGSFHDSGLDVQHGFERDDLAGWLADAGFGPVAFHPCGEIDKHGRSYALFLAACQRAD